MGTDLLGDIRREIDRRLQELRPALEEYEQLLEAADALGLDELSASNGSAPGKAISGRAAPGRAAPRRRTARARGATPSAEDRVERETILGALEHGSHTTGELVVVTAMRTADINGNLRRLSAEGVIAKTEREGKPAWSLLAGD